MDLTNENVTVACVGKGVNFAIHDGEALDKWLTAIEGEERRQAPSAATAAADEEQEVRRAGDDYYLTYKQHMLFTSDIS